MSKADTPALPFLSAAEVRRQIGPDQARRLIESALLSDFDPAEDPARSHVPAGEGHLLLMPSILGDAVGVKIATVTPGNPARGAPRIQALYLLLDSETLTPRAVLDGGVLTALRTPAVTAVACDQLAAEDAERMVVFGTGPQAVEHIVAMTLIRPLSDIRLVGRTPEKTRGALNDLAARGHDAAPGRIQDVEKADIVVCATSAASPLFAHDLVGNGACVAAIGSHEPTRRELPGELLGRSEVFVEDRDTAFREAGDIILAAEEGFIVPEGRNFHDLSALVRGTVRRREDKPNVFKGTGMSWQDLAVVRAINLPADVHGEDVRNSGGIR
ncbi:ornithine cyclodeaminase family protein [Nesterenkonia salmonea]|uniref:Ornithine cyclodeaminase family protein n=1 Tax=Nesterenkonia salmonea TaxID=1804987 RepID=A0A5R9BLS2_9MICC|nr:ornithine cyclodeaminase family protein [Nesterenkonia salmonea]TLQ01063.1 ornithine cyclodeaminase family protein [Nesterenkonia salmonea]